MGIIFTIKLVPCNIKKIYTINWNNMKRLREIIMDKGAVYLVKNEEKLSNDDYTLILCLYRPIIGVQAHALYLALTSQDLILELNTKYEFDNFLVILQMSYEEMIDAKTRLETIGLLKILKREKGKHYIWKPQLPMSVLAFFENTVLSNYLLNKIGSESFDFVKTKFLNKADYIDITGYNIELELKNLTVNLDFAYIDKYLINKNASNKLYLNHRDKIIQLANYYNVVTKELAEFIYQSIELVGNQREFNYDKFQQLLSDFYQKAMLKKQINGDQLNLTITEDNVATPTNMREVKINEMNSIDPIAYLTLLRDNSKPTPLEIDLIRDLVINFSLKPGIVNCLIEYVWFKNGRRIERKYCEKIANTFNQLQIVNVQKAMEHLRGAYSKNQKNKVTKDIFKENAYHHLKQKNNNFVLDKMKNLSANQIYQQPGKEIWEDSIDVNKLIADLKDL